MHHSPHVTAQSGVAAVNPLGRAAAFSKAAAVDNGGFGAALQDSLKAQGIGTKGPSGTQGGAPPQAGSKDVAAGVDKDHAEVEIVVVSTVVPAVVPQDLTGVASQRKPGVGRAEEARSASTKDTDAKADPADDCVAVPVPVAQPELVSALPVAVAPVMSARAELAPALAPKPALVDTKALGSARGGAVAKAGDKAVHGAGAAGAGAASVAAAVEVAPVVAPMTLEAKTIHTGSSVIHVAPVDGVEAGKAGGVEGKAVETSAPAESASAAAPVASDMKTLVATPNVLEIGVASGQHGWVRVRAEMDPAGQVATSLMASSASATEGLHKELPALSAYLTHEQVGFSSLVVNAADKGAGAQDAAANTGGAMQQGSGQAQQDEDGSSRSIGGFRMPFEMDGSGMAGVQIPGAMLASGLGLGTGSWLSVRV